MSDLPRVVAAAIIGEDGKPYSLPPMARHHDIIRWMAGTLKHATPIKGEQGFMLSDGTFANRRRAKMCARANKQLLPGVSESGELFSEDVW